nr:immunoglobulin light chain junction region [Macaca mulatta]
CQQYKSFPYSF